MPQPHSIIILINHFDNNVIQNAETYTILGFSLESWFFLKHFRHLWSTLIHSWSTFIHPLNTSAFPSLICLLMHGSSPNLQHTYSKIGNHTKHWFLANSQAWLSAATNGAKPCSFRLSEFSAGARMRARTLLRARCDHWGIAWIFLYHTFPHLFAHGLISWARA